MKLILAFVFLMTYTSFSQASVFVDLSLGAALRDMQGDKESYKNNISLNGSGAVGLRGERFSIAAELSALIGRQKKMKFNYGEATINDDFNWFTVNVGPTLKYHMTSSESSWEKSPFIGLFYSYSEFTNNKDFTDPLTGRESDLEHDIWGYGAKVGMQFSKTRPETSFLDSINYNIYLAYTKHRRVDGDYVFEDKLKEYDAENSDNLQDYTLGLTVGFTFGDHIWTKTKSALGFE